MICLNHSSFYLVLFWIAFFSFLKESEATNSSLSSDADLLKRQQAREVFEACEYNNIEALKDLLNKQAPIYCAGKYLTGFQYACGHGYEEIVQLFFNTKYCQKELKEQLSKALHEACTAGMLTIVKLLLKKRVPIFCHWTDWTAFQKACYFGHKDIIKSFFNATYCKEELKKQLPKAIYTACHRNNPSTVKLLLEKKGNIDYIDKHYNWTGFQRACYHGYQDIVELFFQESYCNEALKKQLKRALYLACYSNSFSIVDLLLKKKVKMDYRDQEGKTGFLWACLHGYTETMYLFLKHRKEALMKGPVSVIKKITRESHTLLPIDIENLILNFTVDQIAPEDIDKEGNTGLHLAMKKGYGLPITMLLHYGYHPKVFNKKGETPLMLAEKHPNIHAVMLDFLSKKKV